MKNFYLQSSWYRVFLATKLRIFVRPFSIIRPRRSFRSLHIRITVPLNSRVHVFTIFRWYFILFSSPLFHPFLHSKINSEYGNWKLRIHYEGFVSSVFRGQLSCCIFLRFTFLLFDASESHIILSTFFMYTDICSRTYIFECAPFIIVLLLTEIDNFCNSFCSQLLVRSCDYLVTEKTVHREDKYLLHNSSLRTYTYYQMLKLLY